MTFVSIGKMGTQRDHDQIYVFSYYSYGIGQNGPCFSEMTSFPYL